MPSPAATQYQFPMHFNQGLAKVSVYEVSSGPNKYKVYTIAWSIGRKSRQKKSLADPDAAIAFAKEKVQELAHGATLLIEVSAQDWNDYQRQLQRLNGTPLHVPVDFYLSRKQILAHQPRLVSSVIDELLRAKETKGRGVDFTIKLQSHFKHFAETFGEETIDAISAPHLLRYFRGKHWLDKTVTSHLRSITLLFQFAKSNGYLPQNLPIAPEKIGNFSSMPKPKEIFTPKEVDVLLHTVRTDGIPFLALQAFAGLRPQEIIGLRWEDIDSEKKEINLRRTSRWPRRVPILPNLSRWLAFTRKELHISHNNGNGPIVRIAQPQKEFTGRTSQIAAHELGEEFRYKKNGMRYSFICYHQARFGQPEDTAKIAGIDGRSPDATQLPAVTPAEAKEYFSIVP